ncbi:MAG: hypothetical protein D6832_07295 [Alphaproteobacteria bacterium]|nr:MAG: hypothetical protein D6832_07295 [Alphaproteobacteria bacterium]
METEQPIPKPGRAARAGALSVPGFRRYFIGAAGSVQAVWMQRVALGWLAWALSGDAAFVGAVAALLYLPALLAGPLFGVLVDRGDARAMAWAAAAAQAAVNLALVALLLAGLVGPALLAALAAAAGLAAAVQHPTRMSLAPRLVPLELVPSVVALTALNFNLARLVAPAIAGAIIARLGVEWTLALAALAQLPMLVALPGLRPRPVAGQAQGAVGPLMRAGLALAFGPGPLRRAMLVTGLYSLAARAVLELLPVLADAGFGRGAAGLGLLTSAAGGGALLAALGRTVRPGLSAFGPAGRAVAAAGLGSVALAGLAPWWPLALAALALNGFCGTWLAVAVQSEMQLRLGDAMRGRVMSLWVMVGLGATALGAVGQGALVELLGIGPALAASAAAGALALLPLIRRLD